MHCEPCLSGHFICRVAGACSAGRPPRALHSAALRPQGNPFQANFRLISTGRARNRVQRAGRVSVLFSRVCFRVFLSASPSAGWHTLRRSFATCLRHLRKPLACPPVRVVRPLRPAGNSSIVSLVCYTWDHSILPLVLLLIHFIFLHYCVTHYLFPLPFARVWEDVSDRQAQFSADWLDYTGFLQHSQP